MRGIPGPAILAALLITLSSPLFAAANTYVLDATDTSSWPALQVKRTAFQVDILGQAVTSDNVTQSGPSAEDDATYDYTFDYEDVSQPVAGTDSAAIADPACTTINQSIQSGYPFFFYLTSAMAQVAPEPVNAVLKDPNANWTILIPPETESRRVGALFTSNQLSREEVRDAVLVHMVPARLTLKDLKGLPPGTLVPTALEGSALSLSLGTSSSSGSGKGLVDADIDACAKDSVIHTIDGLLVPDDLYEKLETASPADTQAIAVSAPERSETAAESKRSEPFFLEYPKTTFLTIALTVLLAMLGCCLCWRVRRSRLRKRLTKPASEDETSSGVKVEEPDFIPPEKLHFKTTES